MLAVEEVKRASFVVKRVDSIISGSDALSNLLYTEAALMFMLNDYWI